MHSVRETERSTHCDRGVSMRTVVLLRGVVIGQLDNWTVGRVGLSMYLIRSAPDCQTYSDRMEVLHWG